MLFMCLNNNKNKKELVLEIISYTNLYNRRSKDRQIIY